MDFNDFQALMSTKIYALCGHSIYSKYISIIYLMKV